MATEIKKPVRAYASANRDINARRIVEADGISYLIELDTWHLPLDEARAIRDEVVQALNGYPKAVEFIQTLKNHTTNEGLELMCSEFLNLLGALDD